MTDDQKARLNRREFLKVTGAAAIGLLATSGGATAQAQSTNSAAPVATLSAVTSPLRIGVLYPRSKEYSPIGWNMMAGMTLYLEQHDGRLGGRETKIARRSIEIGQRLVQQQAEKALDANRAELLVGMVEPGTIPLLHPILSQRKCLLIANHVGANLPRKGEESPHVYQNSLGYWQANWAMGRWAAQNIGERAFIASSHYESGYDSLYACQLGIEEGGGRVMATRVTHVSPENASFDPILAEIEAAKPDFVAALYSGHLAVRFVRAYGLSGLGKRIPLVGGAYLVQNQLLGRHGDHALGIRSASSWSPTHKSRENQRFVADFRKRFRRNADGFAVLGYETAQWLGRALSAVEGNAGVAELGQALTNVKFAGPRGAFMVDAGTGCADTPVYLRRIQMQNGARENVTSIQLPSVSELDPRLDGLRTSLKTGWLNAYLSV